MSEATTIKPSRVQKILGAVERAGNRLPDPAVLFIVLLAAVWLLSWTLSGIGFAVIDPRTSEPLVVQNQLAPSALTQFFSVMVTNFAHFHPLGVVLV
ncbi:MAG: AbgT family transporter, partial [Xanthomonadales bacterium]|nr:AbgT family transporter [Xanthomonadales bacterium]